MAVLNVMTGIFVEGATKAALNDRNTVIQDELSRRKSYVNDVKTIFMEADVDHSGKVSWEEFENHLQDERVRAFFSSLEIDIAEACGLFRLLDVDGNGDITAEEFISGCLRLKGSSKNVDMATLLYENKRICKRQNSFM